MASNEKLFRDDCSVMMSAHALCPLHLSHPEKMRWMAEYFREHSRAAQLVACTSCNDEGDYHDPTGEWRGYCTCSAGIALRAQPVAVDGMPGRKDPLAFGHMDPEQLEAAGWNACLDTVAPLVAGLRAENERLKEREIVGSFEKCMEALADRDAHAKTIDTLRTANEAMARLLSKVVAFLPEDDCDEADALLASTGGGERG